MQLRPETVEEYTLRFLREYWRHTGHRRAAVLDVIQWIITRVPGTMTEEAFIEYLDNRIVRACRKHGLINLEEGDNNA